jgi:DHA1 family tetracycline resistance protein-like MFS transporter
MRRANPLGTLLQMAKTPLVLGFLGVIFLLQLAAQSQIAIWSYYTIEKFDWSLSDIGWSVAFFGILLALFQGVLTGHLIKRIGDKRTAMLSMAFGVPAFLTFAFAGASWVMILGIFIGAMTGFAFPAMQQMMSTRINEDSQGELQGAIASIMSLTSIFGPVLMTSVFEAFADGQGVYFPGAPFIVAALLSGSGFLLYIATVRRHYR